MKYAAKRIAMLLFTMVIVSLLAFVAFDVISGDPATAMLGTQATPDRVAELEAQVKAGQQISLLDLANAVQKSGCWAFSPETWVPRTATTSRCGT